MSEPHQRQPGAPEPVILGAGDFRYRVDLEWARFPEGPPFPDFCDVDVDSRGRVYAFSRNPHEVTVWDPDGTLVDRWGTGTFGRPHGLTIHEDVVYCTDDGGHAVYRFSLDGELQLTLGTPGEPADFMSGRPFRRCTQTTVTSWGEMFVADGYGNNAIHRYDPSGVYVSSFGRSGIGPGEFNFPHAILTDDEFLYVADRENHRVQKFTLDGSYVTEWRNLHRPLSLRRMPSGHWLVGENGPDYAYSRGAPNLGPRLSVLDAEGDVVTRLNIEPAAGVAPGQFVAPHGFGVSAAGDIYVAQPATVAWPLLFPDQPIPPTAPTLFRLEKIAAA